MSLAPFIPSSTPSVRGDETGTPVGAGCYSFPAVVGSPPRPARREETTSNAWDSGAHSARVIEGNARLAFSVNASSGVVCGFTPANTPPSVDPARVRHGWLMARTNGVVTVRVIEDGVIRAGPFVAAIGELLEVRRVGGVVTYTQGTQLRYTSVTPSVGAIKVAASLYGTEDFIE